MEKVNHIAWDDGVIGQAIEEIIGIPPIYYQKTTKTRCGKRVKLERVDNAAPTCPACIKHRDEEQATYREFEAEIRESLERRKATGRL